MTADPDADWQPEADRQPDAEQPEADQLSDAVETPSQPSGTDPDEWRFGAYPRLVEDTDGCPR